MSDPTRDAIRAALNELGVPDDSYPAPVANAVAILVAALSTTPAPLDAERLGRIRGEAYIQKANANTVLSTADAQWLHRLGR